MILCDATPTCPSPYQISQVVDDTATPDPIVVPPAPKPRPVIRPTSLPTGWGAGQWDRFPARVERSALCIAHHESWTAGLWKARYRGPISSTASGFAQWLGSTWRGQAKRAGVGIQYREAYLAPPAVQAEVFAFQALHHGLYPWVGTNCPGTE